LSKLISDTRDIGEATLEAIDPVFCAFEQQATVWYSFTLATRQLIDVNAAASSYNAFITVVTGSPDFFNNVTCGGPAIQFVAEASQTYYIMVGSLPSSYPSPGNTLQLTVTASEIPPPQANFYYYPSQPSIYDTIQFSDASYDPAGCCFESWAWDFGDGTTGEGPYLTHQYAANGDYTVQLTVTTTDGRTGSISQVVSVQTHDVSIAKLAAPKTGRSNQTGKISVSLASKLAAEIVVVELYKVLPGFDNYQLIGMQELLVPARSSNRTVTINFSYTFTSSDASIGKVTFRAVAFIIGAVDALPGDNELRATTKVSR
jgi:PKD repeat protein